MSAAVVKSVLSHRKLEEPKAEAAEGASATIPQDEAQRARNALNSVYAEDEEKSPSSTNCCIVA